MIEAQKRGSWSGTFHRSRVSPFVFVVASDDEAEVLTLLEELDLPEVTQSGMFDHSHRAWPLLDGAAADLSTYGLPMLPGGLRIYGHSPMRYLAHLLNLEAPKRALTGELAVPTPEELERAFQLQRAKDVEILTAQAEHAMASDAREVLEAVSVYFGRNAANLSRTKKESATTRATAS